jgi:hypothetical protein
LVSVIILRSRAQGGSVPGNGLTGNQGNPDVVLTVDYAYIAPTATTSEPASTSVLEL